MKLCCDCSEPSIFILNQHDLFSSVIGDFTRIFVDTSKYNNDLPTDYLVPKGTIIDISRGKINEDEQFYRKYSLPKIYVNLDSVLTNNFALFEGIKVQDININFCYSLLKFEPVVFFSLQRINCEFYENFIGTRTQGVNTVSVIRLNREDLFLSQLPLSHKRVLLVDSDFKIVNYLQQQLDTTDKIKFRFCHIDLSKECAISYSSYLKFIRHQFTYLFKEQFI